MWKSQKKVVVASDVSFRVLMSVVLVFRGGITSIFRHTSICYFRSGLFQNTAVHVRGEGSLINYNTLSFKYYWRLFTRHILRGFQEHTSIRYFRTVLFQKTAVHVCRRERSLINYNTLTFKYNWRLFKKE